MEFHIFENFVFQFFPGHANICKVQIENWNPKMQNSQKHKILEKPGGLKNDREGLVI